MSPSSDRERDGSLPAETLVSEEVTPVAGSFNASAMAAGEPGVPMAFVWRGREYRVKSVGESHKTLRPCHSGSGEKYVGKHYYTVKAETGETMTLYRARTGSKGDGWILYTIRRNAEPKEVKPMRIAVLVSGGGTNLQALIDAEQSDYEIVSVIADRAETFAIERAKKAGIPTELALPPEGVPRAEARKAVSDRVLAIVHEAKADAIVLAGFLTIMSGDVIAEYANRIVNLHPALLPKFGGKGMWGHHVHEAVLAAGEKESGCTIHLVDSGCDTGPILIQKKVPVLPGDTPDSLAARISGEEHEAIVEGVRLLARKFRAENTGK
jgi:phosphoribosylglycinamide formyltransferase-1